MRGVLIFGGQSVIWNKKAACGGGYKAENMLKMIGVFGIMKMIKIFQTKGEKWHC